MRITRSRHVLVSSTPSMGLYTVAGFVLLAIALLVARPPAAGAFAPSQSSAQPAISSFVATPATINAGASSTLSWTAANATSYAMSPAVGAIKGTSVKVSPGVTTTYTLTAKNGSRTATATVTVTVHAPPTITKFAPSKDKTSPQVGVTLNWAVKEAARVSIDQGIGTLTGSSGSVNVNPQVTTTYVVTAQNTYGTATAKATVQVGALPVISSFAATPPNIATGRSTTLAWGVSGIENGKSTYPLSIDQGVGKVSGGTVKVSPKATTTYTLTAQNAYGTITAKTVVNAGALPVIGSFTATPAAILQGSNQSTMLKWAVNGATAVTINNGVGAVTGATAETTPAATTQYTLTATNVYGSSTATTTVVVGIPPVIQGFSSNPTIEAGPGVSGLLYWSTSGATTVSIDNGVGTVPAMASAFRVNPIAATTYTLTATNALGSVTAKAMVNYRPLATVNNQLLYSEHALFIIPTAKQVTWTGSNNYASVFSTANLTSYVDTLKRTFPGDYVLVVVTAKSLTPDSVPNVWPRRHMADGIGQNAISGGVGVPSICRYNLGSGTVLDGSLGVFDHEIGHVWGIFLSSAVRSNNGHWLANSTDVGQMVETYSDDGYKTTKRIVGDEATGFTWTAVDSVQRNETEVFSDHDLYLMGLAARFPDLYVLSSPVYNADHTVSYATVAKYDQAWMEQNFGVRVPDYTTSDKRFRIGFVHIARDMAEVRAVYQPLERSINHFANAEAIDTKDFRFQIPFLVTTRFRASVDARLADLDGDATPTLSIVGPTYIASPNGCAVVPFTTGDSDGLPPTVSCVPASENCIISSGSVVLSGLSPGTHFMTIKAEDARGKKAFAHFVVDVAE